MALIAGLLHASALVQSAFAASATDPITTVAGTGIAGSEGDGLSATNALLRFPIDAAIGPGGDLFIADFASRRVRKVDTSGIISTVAGNGRRGYGGDGGPAIEATFRSVSAITVDRSGSLYIADNADYRVRRVDPSGIITTVAGNGTWGDSGDGGPASQAQVRSLAGLAVGPAGDLYIADGGSNRVRKINASSGIISTVVGTGGLTGNHGDGGPAAQAETQPVDVLVDDQGNLFIADGGYNRVRKVDASGIITNLAGTGESGYSGDGVPATEAVFNGPSAVTRDGNGNLYIADFANYRVRKVDPFGIITTVAGTGESGYAGDGGPAREAQIVPWGIAADQQGALFIADGDGNRRVRRVGPERLVLAQSATPNPAVESDTITYSFTVTNLAPTASTRVQLTNTLPRGVLFIAGSSQLCRLPPRTATVSCELGTLAPAATATVQFVVKAVAAGELLNRVSAAENDPYLPTNTGVSRTLVSSRHCERVITQDTALGIDIGPCAGNGLVVAADNVTLDLRGHRLYGFLGPSGPASDGAGILVTDRRGVTVKNGVVSHFDAGVYLKGGGSHTLTGLTLTDNNGFDDPFTALLGDGIFLEDSRGNWVVGNTIARNGIFDGIGIYGDGSDDNAVESNVIEHTVGPSDGGQTGQGIAINGATASGDATAASGTRIADNVIRDNSSAGIANINHTKGSILANTIERNGHSNAAGNGIGVQVGFRWNSLTPLELLIEGNEVHQNGEDGIQIRRRAGGVQVRRNNAADNAARVSGFDLRDLNVNCGTNTWWENTWGSGGFSPACTSTGGTAATAAATTTVQPAVGITTSWDPRIRALERNPHAWEQFMNRGR
ncbi:MAG: right-handed parallel beta-helix repeat-containing protein [Actinomycetota bacterium]|nr:right-handed parallel beta-helix repeat-containing protein [Actinomycetota bacterium]